MTYAEELRTEGKLEGKEEVAVNLLKINLNKSTIAETTGLSVKRIQELKEHHNL